ncbi:hypothetical protein HN011_000154 [Eciton burchellii]|nr:hypothetical protein HN011_000154 [Eciton burchellii]
MAENDPPASINYSIANPQNLMSVLDKSKRTIFYIYGYLQSIKDVNVAYIIKALCHGNTDNIVLLDWGKYAEDIYPFSFAKGEKVGVLFARSLQLLKDAGM